MTRVPAGRDAIVELRKLTTYLLNERHPKGRSKAVFLARFGFSAAEPDRLAAALCRTEWSATSPWSA